MNSDQTDPQGFAEHCYRIVVAGELEARRAAWFDGMTLQPAGAAATAICGPLVDQAALFGLLSRIRDLGLVLISVNVLDGSQSTAQKAD